MSHLGNNLPISSLKTTMSLYLKYAVYCLTPHSLCAVQRGCTVHWMVFSTPRDITSPLGIPLVHGGTLGNTMMSVEDIEYTRVFIQIHLFSDFPILIIISPWCTFDFSLHTVLMVFPSVLHIHYTGYVLTMIVDSKLPEMLNTGINISDIEFSEGLWQRFKKGVL